MSYDNLPIGKRTCAQARKALKEMQEKLQEEIVAHQRTDEALNQRLVTQKEQQSGKS